jgi:hypothetical protein
MPAPTRPAPAYWAGVYAAPRKALEKAIEIGIADWLMSTLGTWASAHR